MHDVFSLCQSLSHLHGADRASLRLCCRSNEARRTVNGSAKLSGNRDSCNSANRRLGWAADDHKIDRIGVQLYTVRSEIAKDFEGSLAKVASIGYKEVELAGFKMKDGKVSYFDRSPQEMRSALDRHGLTAPSTHVDYAALSEDNFPKVIEASKIIGHQY